VTTQRVLGPKKIALKVRGLKRKNLAIKAALSELDMEIECPRCSCVVELVFNFEHGVSK
jgi:hypothetical protein